MNETVVAKIYEEMKRIVNEDRIFTKLSVYRMDAINYFKKKNAMDKVNVLKYISNTYVNLYRIDDLYDYFYDRLAYSTKSIDDLVRQANRIAGAGNSSRTMRSEAALSRYRRNIQRARGAMFWRGNIYAETSRQYPRSVYMGINAG